MKRKSLLLMLLLALLAPWTAKAQDFRRNIGEQVVEQIAFVGERNENPRATIATATIGTGTSTNYYPMPGFWGFQYDVYLYKPTDSGADFLANNCVISSIAYNISSNSTTSGAQMTVWVKDVDASSFSLNANDTFEDYITDATQVYYNSSFSSTTGWNTLTFESSFRHRAGKALLVAVYGEGCTTSGGCSRNCYYTSASSTHWYKHADNTNPGTSVTGSVDGNRSNIQVTYPTSTTLTLNVNNNTGGTVSGGGTCDPFYYYLITATPASGYRFLYWKENGSVVSSNAVTYVDMSSDHSYTAYFEPIYTNTATASPTAGGTVAFGSYTYDFDDHTTQGWTNIDADGDHREWELYSNGTLYQVGGMGSGCGRNSSADCIASGSFSNIFGVYSPNNFFVSPKVQLGGSISFYARNLNSSYPEQIGVAVSTHGNTSANDFTTIISSVVTLSGSDWTLYTIDLSSYAGETGYVAIRNYGTTDQFIVLVDDITIVPGSGTSVSGTFCQNQSCSATATANSGYPFSGWYENNSLVNTNTNYTFSVSANRTLTANFSPSNSYCSTATELPCGTENLEGTTMGTPGDPHGLPDADISNYGVWYTFTGTGGSTTISSTPASGYDHELDIVKGSCGNFTKVYYKDGSTGAESYTFTTEVGVTYYVYVAHYSSTSTATNTFTISRTCEAVTAPPMTTMTCGYTYSGTVGTSYNTWSSYTNCNWTEDYEEHIYAYTPPVDGSYTFHATQPSGDPDFFLTTSIATGQTLTTLTGNWNTGNKTVTLTGGTTYYLIVDNCDEGFSSYTVSVDCPRFNLITNSNPSAGGSVSGASGTYAEGETCELTATPVSGYIFSGWTVEGTNSTLSSTSINPTTFTMGIGDATVTANFTPIYTVTVSNDPTAGGTSYIQMEKEIGVGGTATDSYLPCYTLYNYNLTQQIYTAAEIGFAGTISSIAFYNDGDTKTLTDLDFYMVHTNKTTFDNTTDWITVTANDLVYSGSSVTMTAGQWTVINLDTPFSYNGTSNLAIITDEHMQWDGGLACRVFTPASSGNCSIRVYSDGTNYDPTNPTQYTGTLMTVKNQIKFGMASTSITVLDGTSVTLTAVPNADYHFVNWTENNNQASTSNPYTITVNGNHNFVANFALSTHTVSVSVNPANSGSAWVDDGSYNQPSSAVIAHGASCTVVAQYATGYNFVNWTENGSVVSTNPTYTFTVNNDCSLVANFEMAYTTPVVTTSAVTSVTASTATAGGNVSDLGNAHPAQCSQGVVYGTTANPAIGSGTSVAYSHAQTGSYTVDLSSLTSNTLYHVRAWASNPAYTGYGSDVTFTTMVDVTSTTVANVSYTSATLGGAYATGGGATVSAYGVVYGTTANPTLSSGTVVSMSGSNAGFSQSITGLSTGTTYYVRAYATNAAGTSYGPEQSFTTTAQVNITKTITGHQGGNGNWYLLTSPLDGTIAPTDVTNMVASPAENYDLFYFKQDAPVDPETGQGLEWINYKETAENGGGFDLEAGKGYLYANYNTVQLQFTGVPYQGDGQVLLTNTTGYNWSGWNLVGNPYNENAQADVRFYAMNSSGTDIIAAQGYGIGPLEGIFVQYGDYTEVNFSPTGNYKKSANLALNVTQGRGLVDRAIVDFENGGTLAKFQLNPSHTKVYIPKDDKDYAVVMAESDMGEMPVNFKAEKNGAYTISVNAEDVAFGYLHLIDNLTGADVDLLANPSYSFNANVTDYASRFRLVFATANSDDDNFGFYNGSAWVINNDGEAILQVVDVMGRILKSESINGCATVNFSAAPGVYMLRLINGDNERTQKVIVR